MVIMSTKNVKTCLFLHQWWDIFVDDGYQYLMFHSCIMVKNLLFCSEAFEASLILSYCFCLGFLTHISIPFIASMYWIQIANFLHFFRFESSSYSSFQKNLCIRQHMYIYALPLKNVLGQNLRKYNHPFICLSS